MTVQAERAVDLLTRLEALAAGAATDEEARAITARIVAEVRRIKAARWDPYPWQRPHLHPPGWVSLRAPGKEVCDERCADLPPVVPGVHEAWLQRGGRGTGKTDGAAHYINAHAEGPACDHRVPGGHRFTIVAPTQPDAVASCVTGVSGLQSINPGITVTTTKEGTIVRWPNGAVGKVLGAHELRDVNRARAWTNVCVWWLEEAAAMPRLGEMLEQAPPTLRLGPRPHMAITTTPTPREEIVALIEGTDDPALRHIPRAAVQTWGRTRDADRLPAPVRASLERLYEGTSAGLQELDGDLVAAAKGALWVMKPEPVEEGRHPRPAIDLARVAAGSVRSLSHQTAVDPDEDRPFPGVQYVERVIVAVDPPGGHTEAGISVVGTIGRTAYVLADLSLTAPPGTWGAVAVQAFIDYGAIGIACETAYGGDMVESTIDVASKELGVVVPIFRVPTKVGKRLRAEPVVALYQQGRVKHVGPLPGLEREQVLWEPDVTAESPNRIDALVHAVTWIMIAAGGIAKQQNPAQSGRSMRTSLGPGARGQGRRTINRRPN